MRNSNQLSAAFVRTVTAHGVYSDGNGLTLRVDRSGKRWVQRLTINGKRRNIGLGGYCLVSLAEALGPVDIQGPSPGFWDRANNEK